MPTEQDNFDRIVRGSIRFATSECSCATKEPGKCFLCRGGGEVRDHERMFSAGPGGTKINYDLTKPCEFCEGSGVCQHCFGELEIVPEEFGGLVAGNVLMAWFHTMSLTRAAEEFSRFNVQWDVVEAWVQRGIRESPVPTDEQIEQLSEAFSEDPDPVAKASVRLTGGTLSPQEMEELGLTED